MLDLERLHHGVGDTLADLIDTCQQTGGDFQPRPGGRATDVAKQRLKAVQGLPRPIEADLTEQAMFNGIPLRAPRRVMANRHRQAEPITESALQLLFP